MARFSENQIEKLKTHLSLVALLKRQGFTLKKQGKDYVTRCPFHDDKTPSLVVSPDKNLWHCLGACGTGGSVIDWMMQFEQVGFRKAVELLINEENETPTENVELQVKPVIEQSNIEVQALLQNVTAFYHERLLTSPVARDYLKNRGLDSEELISQFKLGFCDRKLHQILGSRNTQQGKTERSLMRDIGLTNKSGIEVFSGSLVVPIINEERVLEVYGRKIHDEKQRKGTPLHRYLPGQHRGVWNLERLSSQREVILCESLIDAMSLWVKGFKNVTTSYGVHGFTDDLLAAFQVNNIERVYIAYDRDEAGDKAARTLISRLSKENIQAVRLKLPPNTDINEWTLVDDDFTENFKACLLSASPPISSLAAAPGNPPVTESKQDELEATVKGDDILIESDNRHYRIRGLDKNKHYEQLKINLMVKKGELFFIDAFDLYQAKSRSQFIKQASIECGVEEPIIKADLGKILLKLESLQEERALKVQEGEKERELTVEETEQAMALLTDTHLMDRVLSDFQKCGVVGEETNLLVAYLACVSRKLDKPLAIIIQSSSAAGKSSLMDAVLNMFPTTERLQFSAMTGQSLYYLSDSSLKHKILAIAEEEGATQASYALKLLQSEGEINIASTGKNADTGDLETQTYHVEGPVMLFLTTTAIDIDEELLNRSLVLTVNESQSQTQAIHVQQRFGDTLEGLLINATKKDITSTHHHAQQLLKPLKVVNPFAEQLQFLSNKTRTRRDHQKYLTLIKSITLLHQYQREIKSVKHGDEIIQYIEVTKDDLHTANRLAHEVLGRSLDELPPQTRTLLQLIVDYVQQQMKVRKVSQNDFLFSRRDIREMSGWGLTQIAIHCQRLEAMEYLIVCSGRRGQAMHYKLCYDGQNQDGESFMLGLEPRLVEQEVAENTHLDVQLSGDKPNLSGSSRPQIGGVSGSNRTPKNTVKANNHQALVDFDKKLIPKSILLAKKPSAQRAAPVSG